MNMMLAVLDRSQRIKRAWRLHAALHTAGLWKADARLLDIGCGSGWLLAALGDDVRQRVGCDLRGGFIHTGTRSGA